MLCKRDTLLRLSFVLLLQALACVASAQETPANLGRGLRDLVELQKTNPTSLRGKALALDLRTGERKLVANPTHAMVVDKANRVLMNVHLSRSSSFEEVRRRVGALGGSVLAEDPAYRQGSLAIYLPVKSVEELARMDGVATLKLVHKGHANVGSVTSQGAGLLHADQVNAAGITGQGITIGLISDSYNNVPESATSAYDDVKSGDLPNMGVPDGRPGLKFLSDGAGDTLGDLDEGRAMAQVAYDCGARHFHVLHHRRTSAKHLSPRMFAVCGPTRLARPISSSTMKAIPFEPWFSDGQAAQAVNDVVTSTTLAGKKVAYFSAAGNSAMATGYASTLRFVANATARAMTGSRCQFEHDTGVSGYGRRLP